MEVRLYSNAHNLYDQISPCIGCVKLLSIMYGVCLKCLKRGLQNVASISRWRYSEVAIKWGYTVYGYICRCPTLWCMYKSSWLFVLLCEAIWNWLDKIEEYSNFTFPQWVIFQSILLIWIESSLLDLIHFLLTYVPNKMVYNCLILYPVKILHQR